MYRFSWSEFKVAKFFPGINSPPVRRERRTEKFGYFPSTENLIFLSPEDDFKAIARLVKLA